MLFPAQNKLPHICIQLKDTYFSSKLDMGAEVNMLLGFGCLGIIVRNVESIFLFDDVIFPSSFKKFLAVLQIYTSTMTQVQSSRSVLTPIIF